MPLRLSAYPTRENNDGLDIENLEDQMKDLKDLEISNVLLLRELKEAKEKCLKLEKKVESLKATQLVQELKEAKEKLWKLEDQFRDQITLNTHLLKESKELKTAKEELIKLNQLLSKRKIGEYILLKFTKEASKDGCSICLETEQDGSKDDNIEWSCLLDCGHVFHQMCINQWTEESCPLCRTDIESGPFNHTF